MTKADEGVAPGHRGAAQVVTHGSAGGAIGVPELTHQEIQEQLSEYLDAALPESARRRIESHLATCQACSHDLGSLRTTVRGIQALPAPSAPAGANARILEQARREHEQAMRDQSQEQHAASHEQHAPSDE